MTADKVREHLLVIRRAFEEGNIEIESHVDCQFELNRTFRESGSQYIEGTVRVKIPDAKS